MRQCTNCGKANQPTRKFCIRCGSKLVSPKKRRSTTTSPAARSTGQVTTGKKAEIAPTPQPTQVEKMSVTTEDRWVKPSEVSRERVRAGKKRTKRKSEMEKAMEAFSRADAVGLEEEGTGVVETRMLRASDVRELMEEPVSPPATAAPTPQATHVEEPSSSPSDDEILGSYSVFIAEEDTSHQPDLKIPASMSQEFSSSKYDNVEVAEATPSTTIAASEGEVCSNCGNIVSDDGFEYPKEVYSSMGQARIKQARFFVVQGKYEDAERIIRVAMSLFSRAEDLDGLTELESLMESIAQRN
jgi:hypothetical protein